MQLWRNKLKHSRISRSRKLAREMHGQRMHSQSQSMHARGERTGEVGLEEGVTLFNSVI